MANLLADFYRGKRVLVTGHTGFEGGWAVAWLKLLGAQVSGYGLPPATRPNFFDATLLDRGMTSIFADIRDRNSLATAFTELQPEIVIHCAAQTNPQSSLEEPVDAFSTNVMGTVHILEEARLTHSVRSVVLVSNASGKELNGKSTNNLLNASVASTELARAAFDKCFFEKNGTAVVTARVADSIGGGDWREGHPAPDLVRSLMSGEPFAASKETQGGLRIWHVLEPIRACLLLALNLFEGDQKSVQALNFAPGDEGQLSYPQFVEKFTGLWNGADAVSHKNSPKPAHRISDHKIESELGGSPVLSADQALAWTVEWYSGFCSEPSSSVRTTESQLEQYMRMMP